MPIASKLPRLLPAADLLNQEFLILRAKALELAAGLDRLERAGDVTGDPRYQRLLRAIADLPGGGANRAERCQLTFSLPYHADWQQTFEFHGGPAGRNDA
ncbi:MAG: hypothetical protein SFX18_05020 [Pirellulales bacterium]|nr:hypothetical protein [Pirellulales bacterium]